MITSDKYYSNQYVSISRISSHYNNKLLYQVLLFLYQVHSVSAKTRGASAPHIRITWTSFLGLKEPSLNLLSSAELQRTNSSPISANCRRSKSDIFILRNKKNIINSFLRLHVGTHYIILLLHLSDERYIPDQSRNEE